MMVKMQSMAFWGGLAGLMLLIWGAKNKAFLGSHLDKDFNLSM